MNSEIIVIYRGNPIEAEMIKDFLNDNGVVATLKNQLMGSIAPWHVSPGGFNPVEIEILLKDREKALELINVFNNSE